MEQGGDRFDRRVGLVNTGIDDVSYVLASQDFMRTSRYWRRMQAFGAAQTRIYDATEDLLGALRHGHFDRRGGSWLFADPVEGHDLQHLDMTHYASLKVFGPDCRHRSASLQLMTC